MRCFAWILLFSTFLCCREVTEAIEEIELASLPPRGWNSYDSYSWIIDEDTFLKNAVIVASRLNVYGYEYVVVDFLWYRKNVEGAPFDSYGNDNIDKWGRPYPDPRRWPSSRDGKGFTEVARLVHDLGLKFGIHVMTGISTQAVNANTPILDVETGATYHKSGQSWSANDIGMKGRTCSWLQNGFMSVNTDIQAGKAFLRSLYQQYAEWSVDFVKLDCVFGENLNSKEIITVSELLEELERPIVFSISPGARATPPMADGISNYVNMYRITGDDWDKWVDVAAHFNVSRDFAVANKIGAEGLRGRSWPDLDMLPFGWLTDPSTAKGPYRNSSLTLDEQKTQMTLWCMAKSPIMFGGDLTQIDDSTFNLITNPILLEIDSHSSNNMEFPYVFTRNVKGHVNKLRKLMSNKLLNSPDIKLLGLTTCDSEKAEGWFSVSLEGFNHICWHGTMKSYNNQPYCLKRAKAHMTSDEETIYKQEYVTYYHLLAPDGTDACLEASASKKGGASETESTSFSKCKRHSAQMWGLSDNGTLINSYTRLCATVQSKKAYDTDRGVRSWIAIGRSEEIYLSFFNLDSHESLISARISDVAKFLGGTFPVGSTCFCSEVWSGKDFGMAQYKRSSTLIGLCCFFPNEHGEAAFGQVLLPPNSPKYYAEKRMFLANTTEPANDYY